MQGLGLALLGKKRLGAGAALLVFLLLALFWYFPNLVTWFIFGATFIAQMGYAVALATTNALVHSPEHRATTRLRKLPERFADKKRMAGEVQASFSQILGSDEQLLAAIVGHKPGSSRLMFTGVTARHLVVADCSQAGNPTDARRIPKEEVTWASLQMDVAKSAMVIETESGQKISLELPGKLNEQAKSIVQEFPGTWSAGRAPSILDEGQEKVNRREENRVLFVALGVMVLGAILATRLEKEAFFRVLNLCFAAFFFIVSWPGFIKLVRDYERDEAGISGMIQAILAGSLSAIYWIAAILLSGLAAVELIQFL